MAAWRKAGCDETSRANKWLSYRYFFESQGYTLWKVYGITHKPPVDVPRAPDGFSYENEYSANHDHMFTSGNAFHFPARTRDSRDVLIALISDGIERNRCLDVLREIATGKNAGIDRNHALPMLHELHYNNITFGVFPLVGSCFIVPWFPSIYHVLEAMSQIMEGVAFLHDHLIAHRDLFISNFLSSCRDGIRPVEHRSFLRPRYYIIDFELAVRFSPDSDPESRTVIGPPADWSIYRRATPPEMRSDYPHCPFKADIWQLGYSLGKCVLHVEEIPDVHELMHAMSADNPELRPSAREAVNRLNELRNNVPSDILQLPLEEPWLDAEESFEL
ncbi:hypothetical protein GYMLUDRAFT_46103 [Collybiopsis luxurians FD-317 M1]|uniref:Protein kinase domain-containing protein n=1 Tax=Collybiopsis luxurians FD-317 M1 TaxID=944289 RepID=A0A0D0CH56_9AGAR|nr:hypothetical protein GYMLUDRAFT_46103 [Collybiopsis luxurians FD-317 M1]